MKKYLNGLGVVGILALSLGFTACSSDNDDPGKVETVTYKWSTDGGLKACDHLTFTTEGKEDVNGTQIGNGDQEFVFTGTQELGKGTYLLKGWVYVANGATLTIDPGTIVKGDKETKAAIIVEPGGKLIAKGTASSPIVFTSEQAAGSRKPGDWGGVILCGKAPNNNGVLNQQIEGGPRTKHGGTDANDNSGVLEYVRIEFAGYPFQTDKEINGLTLGSVGAGTTIDHVQVSFSNDDSFEWFGGTVNCKYLIAYKGWDDDFDTDNGFSGNVQFGLSVRDSKIADASQSNGFESDNNANGTTAEPFTSATFSNITFVGPKAVDANFVNDPSYITGGSYNPNNGSALGKFQAAMHLRRNSRLNVYNSVAIGWPIGLILDNQKGDTQGNAIKGLMKLHNDFFEGMDVTGSDFNKIYEDAKVTDYTTSPVTLDNSQKSFTTQWLTAQASDKILSSYAGKIATTVPYLPTSSADWLTSASFTGLSSWFTQVAYCGAFGTSNDWATGWTEWDPENAAY